MIGLLRQNIFTIFIYYQNMSETKYQLNCFSELINIEGQILPEQKMRHDKISDTKKKSIQRHIKLTAYVLLFLLSISLVLLTSENFSLDQISQQISENPRFLAYNDPNMLCFLGQDKPFVQDLRYQLSPSELLVNTRYPPIVMVTDSTDGFVSNFIANDGTWEPANLKTFSRFVKKGDTILNIGAHIGLEGIVLAKKKAEEQGKLYFFQPYKVSKRILEKNVYLNGLEEITTIYNVAASDRKGRAKMRIVSFNTGMTFMVKQGQEGTLTVSNGQQLIEMNLVDNVLPSDVIVDFVLIDTEMSEIEVLEGMKDTIRRSPNMIIVAEWSGYSKNMNDQEFSSRRDALMAWFNQQKFSFYRIDRPFLGMGAPKNCEKEVFLKMTDQQLIDLGPQMRARGVNIDILIVPNHIDPNTLE